MIARITGFMRTYWKLFVANAALAAWLYLSLLIVGWFPMIITFDLMIVLPGFPIVYGIMTRKKYGKVLIPGGITFVILWLATIPAFAMDTSIFAYSLYLPAYLSGLAALSGLITGLFLRVQAKQEEKLAENIYQQEDPQYWQSLNEIDEQTQKRNDEI